MAARHLWTEKARKRVLDALTSGCSLKRAAEAAGVSTVTLYHERMRDPAFALACTEAIASFHDSHVHDAENTLVELFRPHDDVTEVELPDGKVRVTRKKAVVNVTALLAYLRANTRKYKEGAFESVAEQHESVDEIIKRISARSEA